MNTIDWNAIENSIGFGRPDAPVLFLGMEEGLSRDANLDEDLRARASYAPYEDLLAAQMVLGTPGRFFGDSPISQRTWRPMCHLMLKRDHLTHIDNAARCRYQADRLGRTDGDSLLSELLPYPSRSTGEWEYSRSRESMVEERIALLKGAFASATFELVVAYGSSNWKHYQQIFVCPSWETVDHFKVGQRGTTRVMLSPHLSTKAFNTEAQLDSFAAIALGQR